MTALGLTYSGPRYLDRTVPLETREVVPDGIDLTVNVAPSLGGLREALLEGRADVAELLLGEFVAHAGGDQPGLLGLPIFPARRFAQRWLWVSRSSRLHDLAELRGCRIGWPARAAGGLSWAVSLLRRSAGLGVGDVELVFGRMGGALEKILDGPPPPGVADDGSGASLPEKLMSGEIDCIMSPYPIASGDGGDNVRLLLSDPGTHERAYVRAGGHLPILTVVALRRDVYEGDRWVASTLVDAFAQAKAIGLARLNYYGALAVGLPWLSTMLEEVDDLFDGDAFPYGLDRNRAALEEYLATAAEIGLTTKRLEVDQLFAVEALEHSGVPDMTAYGVPMRGTPVGGSA